MIERMRELGIGWMILFWLLGMAGGILLVELYVGTPVQQIKQTLMICSGGSRGQVKDSPYYKSETLQATTRRND